MVGLVALGLLLTTTAGAQPSGAAVRVGETYAITLDRRMEETTSDGSSAGSSTDVDTLIERVLAVRGDGVEVEFDLPREATPQERAAVWQLPAQAFLPSNGAPYLLNEAALEARVDPWLRKAKWTRAQCGKGFFTWNYFVIECDPRSALRMIEQFHSPQGDLKENADYQTLGAKGSAPLRVRPSSNGSTVLTAVLSVDVDAVRRERGQTAMTVTALTGKVLTLEAAMQEQAKDRIEGTVETIFELGRAGFLDRRTTIYQTVTTKASGSTATQTFTEVLSRRCTSGCS